MTCLAIAAALEWGLLNWDLGGFLHTEISRALANPPYTPAPSKVHLLKTWLSRDLGPKGRLSCAAEEHRDGREQATRKCKLANE